MNVVSGFEWDLDRQGGRRGGARGSKLLNTFGQSLRDTYREVLEEGVPDNLLPLIERLEKNEADSRPAAEG